MAIESIVSLLVALLVGLLIVLVAFAGLKLIAGLRGQASSPTLQAVLNALEPYFYRAIIAGEKSAVGAFGTADTILKGTDKKTVADSVYGLLPDFILVGSLPVPVGVIKSFVPQEIFERRVQDLYDAVDAFVLKNQAYLIKQIDAVITIQPAPESLPDLTGNILGSTVAG